MTLALNNHFDLARTNEFRKIADRTCEILAQYGLSTQGYLSPELPYFNALTEEKQQEALDLIRLFLKSMETTEASGGRLDHLDRSVWGAFSALGLLPPSELFSHLTAGTAIEIYDCNGLQIWRNFTCMQFCSYTLEEVYSVDVYNRYKRDPNKLQDCIAKVGDLLAGKTPEIFNPQVEADVIEETFSQQHLKLAVHHQLFCRLKDRQGKIAAWLVMSSARILGKSRFEPLAELATLRPVADLSL